MNQLTLVFKIQVVLLMSHLADVQFAKVLNRFTNLLQTVCFESTSKLLLKINTDNKGHTLSSKFYP